MFGDYSYSTRRAVISKGHFDGRDYRWLFWPFYKVKKARSPKDKSEIPNYYEKHILAAAKHKFEHMAEEFYRNDKEIFADYCNSTKELARLQTKLNFANTDNQKGLAAMTKAKTALEQFKQPLMGKMLSICLLVAISFGEFFFNIMAFGVFAQPKLETILICLGLGVAIPLLAHFCGVTLRDEKKPQTQKTMAITLIPLIILSFWVFALLREKYIEAIKNIGGMGILKLDFASGTMIFSFIVFNALFFVAMIFLSYLAGHRDLESYNSKKSAFDSAMEHYSNDCEHIEALKRRIEELEQRISDATARRNNEIEQYQHRLENEKYNWDAGLQLYREANGEAREGIDNPYAEVEKPVEVEIPESSLEISWDCNTLMEPQDKNDVLKGR